MELPGQLVAAHSLSDLFDAALEATIRGSKLWLSLTRALSGFYSGCFKVVELLKVLVYRGRGVMRSLWVLKGFRCYSKDCGVYMPDLCHDLAFAG